MRDILDGKIKEKELVNKFNISNLIKNFDLNAKLATLAREAELKVLNIETANALLKRKQRH